MDTYYAMNKHGELEEYVGIVTSVHNLFDIDGNAVDNYISKIGDEEDGND